MLEVIENAAPEALARTALTEMRAMDYAYNEQKEQYAGEQIFDSPVLPQQREIYTASFSRSYPSPTMAEAADGFIRRHVVQHLVKSSQPDIWAHRMMIGDQYRTHHDGYLAPVSFVWYLNDNWRCDWGGLFVTVNEDDSLTAVQPRFNRLIILKGAKVPHFVTKIERHALQPRYAVVGFMKEAW